MEGLGVNLQGKAAVVTGAGSGIGRAIAAALAAAGAAIAVADLSEEGARQSVAEIERAGGRAIPLRADVSRWEQVAPMVEAAVGTFGGVDILVNNAGLQHIDPVHEFPLDQWERLIGVMLSGTFFCTRAALPHMLARRWGRVVNIASIHGLVASPFKSAYVSAKHGVIGFTRTLALEVAEAGITANAVCPGYVRTPLVEGQIAAQAEAHGIPPTEVVERIMLAPAAVKRLLEPAEVASLVLYLCSEAAAGITGAAWPIDGGWTAR